MQIVRSVPRYVNLPKFFATLAASFLIFQGYDVDRCSTLRQWRFTSVNFNQTLLVNQNHHQSLQIINNYPILSDPFESEQPFGKNGRKYYYNNFILVSWVRNSCHCLHYRRIISCVSARIRFRQVSSWTISNSYIAIMQIKYNTLFMFRYLCYKMIHHL